MSIFEFLTKFLVIWHPWHPWVCIRSDLKPLETDINDSSYCGYAECPIMKFHYRNSSSGWCLMHGYWLTKHGGHFEGRRHHMKFFAQFAIWHNFYGCFSCRKKQKAEFWVILDCVCPLGNSRKLLIHRVAYQCLLHQFIICTNPRSNPLNFCGKNNWELRELKISVFLSRTFCFLLHSHENHSKFIG